MCIRDSTMLFDIHKNEWDDTLLKALNIPRAILPRVVDTSGVIGMLDPSILGRAIPVAALCGDQHSALFGQGCFEPGMMIFSVASRTILFSTLSAPPSCKYHVTATTKRNTAATADKR